MGRESRKWSEVYVTDGPAILVSPVFWSGSGKLPPRGAIWFLLERILGTIVLTGRLAAPGGPSPLSERCYQAGLLLLECKVTGKDKGLRKS